MLVLLLLLLLLLLPVLLLLLLLPVLRRRPRPHSCLSTERTFLVDVRRCSNSSAPSTAFQPLTARARRPLCRPLRPLAAAWIFEDAAVASSTVILSARTNTPHFGAQLK